MTANHYPAMARAALPLLALSLVSNLAVLISPLFMMQVLDRVIPSGNIATLLLLALLAASALVLQAFVDAVRDLSLGRLARWLEREGTLLALGAEASEQNMIVVRVAGFSRFVAGPALLAALNAPWIPVFLLVLWVLHPAFPVLLLIMSGLFFVVRTTAQGLSHASKKSEATCQVLEESTLQEARKADRDVGNAMLGRNLRFRFANFQKSRHRFSDQTALVTALQTSTTSLIRHLGQISALALGAWLVTADLLSAGGMIAGSIITSKAYVAVEALLVQWPTIREGRSHYQELSTLPTSEEEGGQPVAAPSGALRVENLIYPRGGGANPRLDRVAFEIQPGECLAIVGSSGSGKSTLLQALSGVATAPIGSVFLGEHEIRGLSTLARFHMIGVLPQRPLIETGTVAENISCFEADPKPEAISLAAKMAGVHGLICALPQSYETDLGQEPYVLSAGQMQRLALARALYAEPRYLFLDEPNALLDSVGERILGQTLLRLKRKGVTIVMAVHRSGLLALADHVLQLDHGRVADFGPKAEVLGRLGMGGRRIELPILESSLPDLKDWLGSQFTRAGDQAFRHRAQIIGEELLKIACAECPADTLSFAEFAFGFLDQARCEVTMTKPMGQDLGHGVGAARSNQSTAQGNLVHLTQDEVRLARVSQLAETLEVSSIDEQTRYRAILDAGKITADDSRENQAL